jgi:hypothetical protein
LITFLIFSSEVFQAATTGSDMITRPSTPLLRLKLLS